MGYNSKYTGQQVEELLDKATTLNVSAEDAGGEVEDVLFEYATTDFVNNAIAEAITTTLNTEV